MITITGNVKDMTGAKWRLVHNGVKVLALIEGMEKTVTTTIHKVEEFDTEQQVFNGIKGLGLEITEGVQQTLMILERS